MRRLEALLAMAVALPLSIAISGCSLQPMPLVAARGTTITIGISPGFRPGFGRVITGDTVVKSPETVGEYLPSQHDVKEDLQRGELVFQMVESDPNDPNDGLDPEDPNYLSEGRLLPLEFVTRIRVDNVAPDAMGNDLFPEGQAVAFVKIPVDVPLGVYEIYVWRFRRDEDTGLFVRAPTTWRAFTGAERDDWYGWGTTLPYRGIPIRVVEEGNCPHLNTGSTECFTGRYGWGRNGTYIGGPFGDPELSEMTPYPALQLEVFETAGDEIPPAAWDLTLNYPVEKLDIKGVAAYGNRSSESIVSWRVSGGTFVCDNLIPETDELHVQVVSPNRAVSRILVAFELKKDNFRNQDCEEGGRAFLSDFTVSELTTYDPDGQEVPAPVWELYDDYML